MWFCLNCVVFLILGLVLCGNVRGLKTNGNLAVEAVATGKSRGDPDSVVDGRRAGSRSGTDDCFTVFGDDPSITVTLKNRAQVSYVLVYTTAEDAEGERQEGPNVYVGEEKCAGGVGAEQRGRAILEVICPTPLWGTRVTLTLPGPDRTFRLCEVEVYDNTCDCLEGCEVDQGFCFGPCVRKTRCRRENMALFQPADSSELIRASGPPSLVVNGNTGTIFISRKDTNDVDEQNCIVSRRVRTSALQPQNASLTSSTSRRKRMTSSPMTRGKRMTSSSKGNVSAWWSVDLEQEVTVRGVVVYRGNAGEVWANEAMTKITVDGETCAQYGAETEALSMDELLRPRLVVTCERVIRGREVKISRVGVAATVEPVPLELCEVEIWSCIPGWYQYDCRMRCGSCRGGRTNCDTVTGDCNDGCLDTWFGSTCKRKCSDRCLNSRCHEDTGHCVQCPRNRALPFCTECIAGWHGSSCNERCGACKDNTPCDPITGHCDQGCVQGRLPPFCVQEGTETTTTTTTITLITSTTTPANASTNNDTTADADANDNSDSSSTIGTTIGVVLGSLVVVGGVVVVVVWYRRRRGKLDTERETTSDLPPAGKPEAVKTESLSYIDAMSSSTRASTKSSAVMTDNSTSDGAEDHVYETLNMSEYANVEGTDEHVYVKPNFARGLSQSSSSSGGYVNLGASSETT